MKSGKSPIAVMSFNRPQYLRPVLESLAPQIGASADREIFLFQDGARNPFSGRAHSAPEPILECIALFERFFPQGRVLASPENLGVALNFDRAEKLLFEDRQFEAAIFIEDDLVLSPHYIGALDRLVTQFESDERVGYIGAYGDHRMSLAEQTARRSQLILLDHNWAFAVYRRQWLRIRPYVQDYMNLVRGVDYTQRDHKRIAELFAAWGFGCPASSQDSAKTIACCATRTIKINTMICYGQYIGERGIHMNAAEFERRGYRNTEMFPSSPVEFDPISDEDYRRILASQLHWAGKPRVPAPAMRSETPPAAASDKAPNSASAWLSRRVERDDVIACYRWLLGRNPESEAVIDQWIERMADSGSVSHLRDAFLRSQEFIGKLAAARERASG